MTGGFRSFGSAASTAVRHIARPGCADLSSGLASRVDDVVSALLPNARRSGGYWLIGSVEGEKGGSLYIHRSPSRAGNWTDEATGEFGDLLDLIQATLKVDIHGARTWAARFLGIEEGKPWSPPPAPPPRAPDQVTEDQMIAREAARGLWRAAAPSAGTLVQEYIRWRGISLPIPPTIRYSPSLKHTTGLFLPAMLAAIQASDGKVTAVQRTYLRMDGRGKAGVSAPKLTLGPMLDGALRLGPAGEVLGIAEGFETGLSAMELHPGVTVWCALGSRLDAIAVPDLVRQVVIFADLGEAGQRAADRAAERHQRDGRQVEIASPPQAKGVKDWNDVLRQRGAA